MVKIIRNMIPPWRFYEAVEEMRSRITDVCVGDPLTRVEYGNIIVAFDLVRIGHKAGMVLGSYALRGKPLVLQVGSEQSIIGLHAFVYDMGESGKRIGIIPASLAFGEEGSRDENGKCIVPENADLYCAIELCATAPSKEKWN